MLLVHTLNKELGGSQTAFSKSKIRASFQTHAEVGGFGQATVHLVEALFNNNPADTFANQFNSSSNSALYFKPLPQVLELYHIGFLPEVHTSLVSRRPRVSGRLGASEIQTGSQQFQKNGNLNPLNTQATHLTHDSGLGLADIDRELQMWH
jgi:hypothetical protein